MNIPDEVRKCVAFVGVKKTDGDIELRGTAFWIGRDIPGTGRACCYLVTAKHVIYKAKCLGVEELYIRFNSKNGDVKWLPSRISDWCFHPTEENVDVAITPGVLGDDLDHLLIPIDGFKTHVDLVASDIGVGQEVFLAGLFRHHYGKQKNIPIIRIGNIAAMPDERIRTREYGAIDAYLIETRSLGGLSGSPVFVSMGNFSTSADGELLIMRRPPFYLIGLMHGHYETPALKTDSTVEDSSGAQSVNMGIGLVVPTAKILETLDGPRIREFEQLVETNVRKLIADGKLSSQGS